MKRNLTRRDAIRNLGYSGLGALVLPHLGFADVHPFMNDNTGQMLQRIIPSSGEKLSVVGLGSWLQFDVGAAAGDREPLTGVLKRMLEKGGQVIDSSPMYGKAEEVVGDLTAASGNADKYFYATKVWTSGERNGITQMEASMKKMKRKTMDLMQVHNLQDWQTHLRTINKWKAEGRIRYSGVTHYTVSSHDKLEQIAKSRSVDFIQVNYSLRDRNAEKSLLKVCRDNGVAVIINQPFESGELFSLVRGKSLPPWAAEYDIKSWAQFFLKFILANEAVNCAIPGTSNPVHLADNMEAGYGKLPDAKGCKRMVDYIESL